MKIILAAITAAALAAGATLAFTMMHPEPKTLAEGIAARCAERFSDSLMRQGCIADQLEAARTFPVPETDSEKADYEGCKSGMNEFDFSARALCYRLLRKAR